MKVIALFFVLAIADCMEMVINGKALLRSEWNDVPAGAKVISKVPLKLDACKSDGKWPKLDKFDLVISWWTDKYQSDNKMAHNPEVTFNLEMQSGAKTGVLNQAEIMYSLRSYEKYGLLDQVNQVFILIDKDVLSKFGAPRFFDYGNTNIKVISSEDLGLGQGGQWEKLTRMHMIPGLSDYFLWLPDDNFMLAKFSVDKVWSSLEHAPKLHDFGTYSPGWCDGEKPVGALHGPVLLQKCAMNAVMERYFPDQNQQTVVLNAMKDEKPIDSLCLFTHAMKHDWFFDKDDIHFYGQCHTNSVCHVQNQTMFVNIQGFQVSDEYGLDRQMGENAQKFMPNGALKFFESNYPTPSRFEKQGFFSAAEIRGSG